MQSDPELTGTALPVSSPSSHAHDSSLVHCPFCGSTQFFGSKKVTGIGWALYISALVNIPISLLLMFFLIGFVTIFLSPVLAIIGFYGCRKLVNTCARCKKDF